MAEQQEPINRKVALKVIKLGMDTKQVIARYGFGDGELTAKEQKTWDRCASNAEYQALDGRANGTDCFSLSRPDVGRILMTGSKY